MHVRRYLVVPMIALFTALALSACSDQAATGGETGVRCSSDTDCVAGTACEWERCRTTCENSTECPSDLRCHPRGVCAECGAQVDCDANTYCFRGQCLESSELDVDVKFGVPCESDNECLNGEICLNEACTPLCQSDYECRPPRGLCDPENICVQCIDDGDCQIGASCVDSRCESNTDQSACDPACEISVGQYCNEESGDCQTVRCLPCDKDSDCSGAERCLADRAVNGARLCLLQSKNCPVGYNADDAGICRPVAMCADVEYAGAGEACRFPANENLGACGKDLRCLYNSRVSFCSPDCEATADCLPEFEGGCCDSFTGGQTYCLTQAFCEQLDASRE
jgi:hypothetical protein